MQLPNYSAARVLVVGDLMLDRYWHGPTSRISPEAPVPVVHVKQDEQRAGGAGNVALNIAALGAKASLLGFTGEDEAAVALETLLKKAGVLCLFQGISNIIANLINSNTVLWYCTTNWATDIVITNFNAA